MVWPLLLSAGLSAGASYLQQSSANRQAARSAGAVSRAEGEAVVRERLNKTVSNSYAAAFAQMRLGLQKRQLSAQGAEVGAAALAARGSAEASNAASGSIGASTQAVLSDIDSKASAAQDQIDQAWEQAVVNYNNELDMSVLNTDQSAPNVRRVQYQGPSTGQMLGGALLAGMGQFASQYAMRRMSLDPGPKVPDPVSEFLRGTRGSGD